MCPPILSLSTTWGYVGVGLCLEESLFCVRLGREVECVVCEDGKFFFFVC